MEIRNETIAAEHADAPPDSRRAENQRRQTDRSVTARTLFPRTTNRSSESVSLRNRKHESSVSHI